MHIAEPVGVPGAPFETLEALQGALEQREGEVKAYLLTDNQGHRSSGRYAALLLRGGEGTLSREAFGPRYGEAGAKGLDALVRGLLAHGVREFKEVVVMPSAFTRLMQDPDEDALEHLLSSANPVDPNVYLGEGLTDVPFAPTSSPLE